MSEQQEGRRAAFLSMAAEMGLTDEEAAALLERGVDYAERHASLVGTGWRIGDPVDLDWIRRRWTRTVEQEAGAHQAGWPTWHQR